MEIIEDLLAYPYRFWLILGGVLLASELIGASGYLLWSSVSAIIIALITWLFPIDWYWQWGLFAVLTLATAIIWWRWLKHRAIAEHPTLNQPNKLLIGRKLTLTEPIVNGVGRINLADGSWRIQCQQDLPARTDIRIIAVESITLIVEPIR